MIQGRPSLQGGPDAAQYALKYTRVNDQKIQGGPSLQGGPDAAAWAAETHQGQSPNDPGWPFTPGQDVSCLRPYISRVGQTPCTNAAETHQGQT